MPKKLFGFVIAGVVGAIATVTVMVLLGSSWRETMPASTLVGVVLPGITYYGIRKTEQAAND